MTDTGSLTPSAEAVDWQRRADQWAQQSESEQDQAVEPVNRWSEVASTGRTTFPADGVGWRTETAEWRATAARWRQTTEWRSTTGSHGWRSTTEAWQSGDNREQNPPAETPTAQPSISSTAWSSTADRTESPQQPAADTRPSWQQFTEPATETPSWQQPAPSTRQQPAPRAPAESSPSWQQLVEPSPAPTASSWTAPAQHTTPSWQRDAIEGSATWSDTARTPAPPPAAFNGFDATSRRQRTEDTPETPSWQTPRDDGRHLVREDDRAAWRRDADLGENSRPVGRRRARENGSRPSGGTGWAAREDADNWAGYADTGSIQLFPDAATPEPPSWSARSQAPSRNGDRAGYDSSGGPLPDSTYGRSAYGETPARRAEPTDTYRGGRRSLPDLPYEPTPYNDTTPGTRSIDYGSGTRHGDEGTSGTYSDGVPSRADRDGYAGSGPMRYGDDTRPVTTPGRYGDDGRPGAVPARYDEEPRPGDTGRGYGDARSAGSPTNGYSSAPTTGYPSAPTNGYPSAPTTGYPSAPTTGYPRTAPTSGYPPPEARGSATPARYPDADRSTPDDRYATDRQTADDRRPSDDQRPPDDRYPGAARGDANPSRHAGGTRYPDSPTSRGGESKTARFAIEGPPAGPIRRSGRRGGPDDEQDQAPRRGRAGPRYHDDAQADWRDQTGSWEAEPDTSNWTRDPDTGQWSRSVDDPRVLAWREEAARREAMGEGPAAPLDDRPTRRRGAADDRAGDDRSADDRPVQRRALPAAPSDVRRRDDDRLDQDQDEDHDDDWRGGRGGPRGSAPTSGVPRGGARGTGTARGGIAPASGIPRNGVAPASGLPGNSPRSGPPAAARSGAPQYGAPYGAPRDPYAAPADSYDGPATNSSSAGSRATPYGAPQDPYGEPEDPYDDGRLASGRRRADEPPAEGRRRAAAESDLDYGREHVRDLGRNSGREEGRDLSRERDWEPDRGQDRESSRERDWESGRGQDREPRRDPDRERDWESGRGQDREPRRDPDRERDRESGRGQDREPRRDPDRERDRGSGREQGRARVESGYSAAPISPDVRRRDPEPRPSGRSAVGDGGADEVDRRWPPGGGAPERERESRDQGEPGAWRRAERKEAARGSASYREGGADDWRRDLADQSDPAQGESRRSGPSDYAPFRSSGSAAVSRSSNLSMTSTSLITPLRDPSPYGDPSPYDSGVRQRGGTGFNAPSGAYERRPVTGGFSVSRMGDLLDPDDEEDEESPGGPLAAVGYTVIWYGVPVVLFIIYMFVFTGGQQSHALTTLAKAAPQFGISLVLSVLVAVGIRRVSSSWKAVSVGLAAAVVGGGLATVLSSAITGNALS